MKTWLSFAWLFLVANSGQGAEIRFLGRAEIPSAAADFSGEQGTLEGDIPACQLGGFGSGIAWTGSGPRYALISDRGPADGKTSYRCRYHIAEILVKEGANPAVTFKLLETRLLSNSQGSPFVGSLNALADGANSRGVRMDPEAIRVTRNGRVLISEEYGPSIFEFNPAGQQIGQLPVPPRFLSQHPSSDPSQELPPTSQQGRQPNRGLECLAVSPDGAMVYALLQSPLIQDGGLDDMNKRVGTNSRLLEIHRATGKTREYLYPLDAPGNGCNEIEFYADGRFLVIERDSKAGGEAAVKQIMEIDIRQATDISKIASLPSTEIPQGVVPVSKRPFLDLLDPRWKLAGENFPEKIEGIAFGPPLKDKSRLLLITSDNDFLPTPSQIYAFAVRDE